jgi:hypothetical protein
MVFVTAMRRVRLMARRFDWQSTAVLGLLLCLLVSLAHPVITHAIQLFPFIVLPLFLFGLVPAPRIFWPAREEQLFRALAVARADLFQRPPPSRKK